MGGGGGGGWVVQQQNRVTPSPFNFGLWTLELDFDLDCDNLKGVSLSIVEVG